MPWGVLAAGVVGAAASSNSAKKASKAQQESADKSLALQQEQFNQSRLDSAPYRDVGTSALNRIADLLKLERAAPVTAPDRNSFIRQGTAPGQKSNAIYDAADPAHQHALNTLPGIKSIFGKKKQQEAPTYFDQAGYDAALEKYNQDMAVFQHRKQGTDVFEADPGYEFRLGEGNKAIENAARARGQYFSPSTVKELTRYGQGFASNEFGNVYNRLAGLAGTGQTAVNNSSMLGQNFATNAGNNMMSAGNARGAAAIAQGNAWGNALSGFGNTYAQQNTLKDLFKTQNSPWTTPSYAGIGSDTNFGTGTFY